MMSGSSPLPAAGAPRELNLSGLDLAALPEALLSPKSLPEASSVRALDLSCNRLRRLELDLSPLTSLETLNLSDNQLTTLEGLILPASLRTLQLNGNQLASFPLLTLLSQCPSLTSLYLSGNKLASLPEGLEELVALRTLYLGSNQLSSLPEGLLFPPGLVSLYLGGNRLSAVPATLGLLTRLRVLHLHDNQLTELPASLVQLSELEVLNLHRNRLALLPVELLGLRKLRQLSVRQNPLLTRFAGSYHRHLPSLQELAARAIKQHAIPYSPEALPPALCDLLDSSSRCLGCGGPYFGNNCVSHIEFVDLCGSYRVPFLQYICSARCKEEVKGTGGHRQEAALPLTPLAKVARLRKILLDKYCPSESVALEELQRELEENEEAGSDLV